MDCSACFFYAEREVKITIQKSAAGNDKAGNHVLAWQDYYTCHAKRGGGRVRAFPHIAPAEQAGIRELEEGIKRGLEG